MTTTTGIDNNPLNNYIQQQQQQAAAAAAANGSSNTAGANTLQGLSGNFNTFLQILTTQLTHQDPTSATDTNQFTQELVQFSQVEQQLNTNSDLQQLINLQKASGGMAGAIGYIGKFAEAASASKVPLQNKQAEIAYSLPSAAKSVTVTVSDANGNTVATLKGPTTIGLDRVAWDGKSADGTQQPDGIYNFTLNAVDSGGSAITVTDTRIVGMVTSLQTNSDGTVSLSMGDMSIKNSDVDAVYDASSPPIATLGDPASG